METFFYELYILKREKALWGTGGFSGFLFAARWKLDEWAEMRNDKHYLALK